MAKGIFAALEDLEEPAVDSEVYGDTPYGEDIEEADSDARDEMEDAEQESDHIDDIMEEADNGNVDTETLQEIGESIGEAADSSVGIDEVAIKPAIIATERLCQQLGMKEFKIMPSLEAFGSANSRVAATKRAAIAIEGVVDTAIDKLKKAMQYISEKIGKFISNIVAMYRSSLLQYQLKLKKEVAKLPDGKGADLSSKSVFRAFGLPSTGRVDEKNAKKVLDAHEAMGKAATKMSGEFKTVVDKIVKDAKDKEISVVKNEANALLAKSYKDTFSGRDLVDGVHVEVTKQNDWDRPTYKSAWDGKDVKEDAKCACLSKGDMGPLLTQVETIMKDAIKTQKEVTGMLADGLKALTEVKNAGLDDGKSRVVMTSVNKLYHDHLLVSKEIFRLESRAVKAALDYCKESIASIKSSKKEGGKKEGNEGK